MADYALNKQALEQTTLEICRPVDRLLHWLDTECP